MFHNVKFLVELLWQHIILKSGRISKRCQKFLSVIPCDSHCTQERNKVQFCTWSSRTVLCFPCSQGVLCSIGWNNFLKFVWMTCPHELLILLLLFTLMLMFPGNQSYRYLLKRKHVFEIVSRPFLSHSTTKGLDSNCAPIRNISTKSEVSRILIDSTISRSVPMLSSMNGELYTKCVDLLSANLGIDEVAKARSDEIYIPLFLYVNTLLSSMSHRRPLILGISAPQVTQVIFTKQKA